MRLSAIPKEEYDRRIKSLQSVLEKNNIDCFVGYSSECESATSRYLTGFWPFFDFASVVVPVEGKPVLITGGPESSEFARAFSAISNIKIDPSLVESSAPEWMIPVSGESLDSIIVDACKKIPHRIAIANWNIFPKQLFDEILNIDPNLEVMKGDCYLLEVKSIKSKVEIPYIKKAYQITEEAMKEALLRAEPGKEEWELEAVARMKMLELGAEGMSYPAWVCSGPNTKLSLARSTDRVIQKNELVQFTFGAKFMGYCGNMCRPFSIGKAPESARKLMEVALEGMNYALENIRPGAKASTLFDGYYKILSKYGYEEYSLYGPAHGTGSSEVEGLWLSKNANFIIKPYMLFNIDIWISDGKNGVRYEDGILVKENGIEELTFYKREIIEI